MIQNKDQLSENLAFLHEKLRIMTLMELVFNRSVDSRQLTFEQISQACDLQQDQVEILLMKAFSIKVIRGVIDQVGGTVRFSWVQPRVLDVTQIVNLRDRLKHWSSKVHETANYLQENAPQLLEQK